MVPNMANSNLKFILTIYFTEIKGTPTTSVLCGRALHRNHFLSYRYYERSDSFGHCIVSCRSKATAYITLDCLALDCKGTIRLSETQLKGHNFYYGK